MLYANGYPVGGGGGGSEIIDGIDGVFIDTDNVIFAETINDGSIVHSTYSYTATEDCMAVVLANGYSGGSVTGMLNGTAEVFRIVSAGIFVKSIIPMKKGQTLSFTNLQAYAYFAVYGIQTGTTHSKFQPVIYSTEEREIGVWKDGRPLYQKTVDFGALPNNTTKTVSYNISDLDYFVKIQCVAHNQNGSRNIPFVDDANKSSDVLLDTIKSSGVLRIIAHTDLSSLTGDVTLQYVKSTDTAGSGTWTPQGVPAEHYSTDEQIIGTYFGDTLYQKTIVLTSDVVIADSWTTIYTDALIGNIAQLVDGKYNNVDNKGVYGVLNFKPNGNNLQAVYPISGGLNVLAGARFTLQYTKSS